MSETIRIIPYQDKHKDQVIAMHRRLMPTNLEVKRFKWIGLFINSNGTFLSIIYFSLIVYISNFALSLVTSYANIFITALLLSLFLLLVFFPYLSKLLAKQAARYTQSIAENDLEDIPSNYQSCKDKNFWVAIDEYDNVTIAYHDTFVCGCIGMQNTMPMETMHHLGKYIKVTDDIKVAELKRLYVSEKHRRKGIANKLIQESVKFAKEQHFSAIVVTLISISLPSVALYKKSGFFFVSSFFFQVLWKIFGISVEVYLKLL